ncbi:MAG: 4Fe-4S binding protein [Desulfobacteraceae bacterium]|nr:4Fe-4S binding protein [Desulfobacteraceae bacterium]
MHFLKVESDSCTGCQTCLDVCFVNAISFDENEEIPFLAYPEDCQICAVCEAVCPENALEIIPDWESRYYPEILSTGRRS